MTQQQLGEALNVTAQAISKWENNQAEPDLHNVKKMSTIFKVSIDDFLDYETEDNHQDTNVNTEQVISAVTTAINNQPQTLGYCVHCGTAVTENNKGVLSPKVLCDKCLKTIAAKKRAEEQQKENERKHAEYRAKARLKKGLILSSILSAFVLTVGLITTFRSVGMYQTDMIIFSFFFSLYLSYATFAFIMELYIGQDGPVHNVLIWLVSRPIKLPGVIFSLDIGGFIFFILVKIGLAILGFFIGIFLFLLGLAIGAIISPFTFPFTIKRYKRGKIAPPQKPKIISD